MSSEAQEPRGPSSRFLAIFRSGPVLLLAFALAIMADPISSTAYAIEAALGELNSDLRLILPTMGLMVLVIGVIVANYSQLVSRFPRVVGGQRLRVGPSASPGRSCRSGRS